MHADNICVFLDEKKDVIRELEHIHEHWQMMLPPLPPTFNEAQMSGEKQAKHPLICQTNTRGAQQGVEHRVTVREWAEEEATRLLRRADKGAITRSRREAGSQGPVLKSSGAAARRQVNAAP